jgi:hypothetical protein
MVISWQHWAVKSISKMMFYQQIFAMSRLCLTESLLLWSIIRKSLNPKPELVVDLNPS